MPHVVVVDDSSEVRTLLQRRLTQAGFSVSAVGSALGGMEMIRHQQPDAVVLAVEMSPQDGIWCLERMRRDPDMIGMPVVLMSVRPAREIIIRAAQFKVQGIVVMDNQLIPEILDRLSRLKSHIRRENNRVAAEILFSLKVAGGQPPHPLPPRVP